MGVNVKIKKNISGKFVNADGKYEKTFHEELVTRLTETKSGKICCRKFQRKLSYRKLFSIQQAKKKRDKRSKEERKNEEETKGVKEGNE